MDEGAAPRCARGRWRCTMVSPRWRGHCWLLAAGCWRSCRGRRGCGGAADGASQASITNGTAGVWLLTSHPCVAVLLLAVFSGWQPCVGSMYVQRDVCRRVWRSVDGEVDHVVRSRIVCAASRLARVPRGRALARAAWAQSAVCGQCFTAALFVTDVNVCRCTYC